MMRKIKIFPLLLIFLSCFSTLHADLDIFGYFENRFFILKKGNLSLKDISEKFSLGDYNRLRLQFKS